MKPLQMTDGVWWVGALDYDLRVFDIVMQTEYGTTYNAYVVKGKEKTALIETVKVKFLPEYLERIKDLVNLAEIDYLIVNHTEPDHTGSIETILKDAPRMVIVGSQVALNFLRQIANRDFPSMVVKDGDKLDLGGKTLRFIDAPFLHWPDSIYTYLEEDRLLFTCDSFGSHYADERVFSDLIDHDYEDAYKYYFDNIIGPYKPYMAEALDKIEHLAIDAICTGHGPVLRHNLEHFIGRYREWTRALPPNEKPKVVVPYVSAYGYTRTLANSIVDGMAMMGDFDVKLYDLVETPVEEVLPEIETADALLFGSPTIVGDALPPIWEILIKLSPVIHGNKLAGAFGSYGWSGEAVPNIEARLRSLRMDVVPGFKVNFKPSDPQLEYAFEWGVNFGRKLLEHMQPKSKTKWRCLVCGQVFEGEEPPRVCPACGVTQENFERVDIEDEFNKDTGETFVIIGSGIAALSAAEAVRKRNGTAVIKMVTAERQPVYYRPALSDLLSEDLPDEELYVHEQSWYSENGIELVTETEAAAYDVKNKAVTCSSGDIIKYDKLIIATGARCNIPPISGTDLKNVFVLRTLDHALAIKEAAKSAKKAVVVGGGVLGLEAAWEMKSLGLEVTVVEFMPRIMPRQLDPAGSARLEKIITDAGIRLILGTAVEAVLGIDRAAGLKLSDGQELPLDFVIFSAGVKPNIEAGQAAGINVNRAIVVDKAMRTGVSDVFACGDCAEVDGVNAGLWPVAAEMGRIAGANAAGDWLEYEQPKLSTMLAAFEWEIFSVGDVGDTEGCAVVEVNDPTDGSYKKYYLRDGILTAVIIIAPKADVAGALRALGQGTVKADKWKCRRCGYIHEGAEPPDSCPVCAAPRNMFDPIK